MDQTEDVSGSEISTDWLPRTTVCSVFYTFKIKKGTEGRLREPGKQGRDGYVIGFQDS